MRPLFTIHAGEFLVADRIGRRFGHKYDVWVPAKDTGIDLLVTRKQRRGRPVSLQVKFSRGFSIREEMSRHLVATSWFTLDPKKVRNSQAELWVFVILTSRHEEHFVVIPTRELRRRIPAGNPKTWHLYLWVYEDKSCYQVRDIGREELLDTVHRGVRDRRRDFSAWLEKWNLLETFTKVSR